MTGATSSLRRTSRVSRKRAAPIREPDTLHEILFPSDLSPASDRAFDHARLLAEQFDSRLVLYHAIEVDSAADLGDPPQPARELWRRVELAAHEHLSHRSAQASVASEIRIERTRSVPRAVVGFVQAQRPDLTVMATHGRGGLASFVLGSIAERVLRVSRTPLLCVRAPEHGTALRYRRLLVPTDLSPASRHAFPLAVLLARAFGAEVLALHAVDLHARVTSGVTDVMERMVPSEEALLRFFQPDFAGVRVLPRVQLGGAGDAITRLAHDERVDLIVMSTKGQDSFADRVFGTHAERVVRTASCPVLVA
jgi:nucleotide-binding universal stress UspA family protein